MTSVLKQLVAFLLHLIHFGRVGKHLEATCKMTFLLLWNLPSLQVNFCSKVGVKNRKLPICIDGMEVKWKNYISLNWQLQIVLEKQLQYFSISYVTAVSQLSDFFRNLKMVLYIVLELQIDIRSSDSCLKSLF